MTPGMAREHGPMARDQSAVPDDLQQTLQHMAAAHPIIDECINIYGRSEMLQLLDRVVHAWIINDPIEDVIDDEDGELRRDAARLMEHFIAEPLV